MTRVRFHDSNFRLACLDILFNLGYFKSELNDALSIEVASDEYEPNTQRLDAMEQITVTQQHLDEIEQFAPDGGDDIYFHVFPRWGGTESELYIASFADIALLRNVRRVWVYAVAYESSLDLSHFRNQPHLKSLETDWFYVNQRTSSRQIIRELTERGVAVTISGMTKEMG